MIMRYAFMYMTYMTNAFGTDLIDMRKMLTSR